MGFASVLAFLLVALPVRASNELAWPAVETQAKPHTYWWWMGSAVDTNDIARELTRYHDAGLGGVHIIPIYGAKGWESNYIRYLSPRWMDMLDYTVSEADRLGMEVDMTTGTGWCFGGPEVTDEEANAVMVSRRWSVAAGGDLPDKVDPDRTQALMAFGPNARREDLLNRITPAGRVDWTAPDGEWTVYAVSQKPSGQKVKRAAPGGEGWMLNLAYPQAMKHYLRWFDEAFDSYHGARPRAQYHDSYEYKTDWSPTLLDEFERRRGYRLQDHLDVFLTGEPGDLAARVKCDYRETISDVMVEQTLPMWVEWCHEQDFITRNEAHGSPGNWLDLYAVADIPETEMFGDDRNILLSKFASSAAHVTGKPLVSAETGTWLTEHFTETLADMKYLLDDLFLAGVNHVFYHGTCYSPDEVPWPGWVFYASYQMNPRNSVWHDVDALNLYATRCQSVLQAGQPDNDILLYWPIHDLWSDPAGMTRNLSIHERGWFDAQPIGEIARRLWGRGYRFDYVSDRQLSSAVMSLDSISLRRLGGGDYRVVVVPKCEFIAPDTMCVLLELARTGGTVVFPDGLPEEAAGFVRSDAEREQFQELKEQAQSLNRGITARRGKVLVGSFESALAAAGVRREALFDVPGLMCVRRKLADGGRYYFVANRGEATVDGWIPLATRAASVGVMDPSTGATAAGSCRRTAGGETEVRLHLSPGASVILRTFDSGGLDGPAYPLWRQAGDRAELGGRWQVKFLSGGPELPAPFTTDSLGSWTALGDTNATRFAGTALYSLNFDLPTDYLEAGRQTFELDLGEVRQSARVRLNGRDCSTLITPPFRVVVDHLKPTDNLLEVEVTNTSANRIRDLDQRGVSWQRFHDINFVNIDYKKFDASGWPLADSGLLGPVTLTPVRAEAPASSK